MAKKENLIDGKRYVITFNNNQDSVSAIWVAEYGVFSFSMGSVSYNEVNKID